MKKLIPLLTVVLATLFAAPVAEARGCHSRNYVSFHRSCGGPAWVETYVAYYDHCGRPVFRTRVVPVRRHCAPVRRIHRSAPACRPAVPHVHGGVSIQFGGYR